MVEFLIGLTIILLGVLALTGAFYITIKFKNGFYWLAGIWVIFFLTILSKPLGEYVLNSWTH